MAAHGLLAHLPYVWLLSHMCHMFTGVASGRLRDGSLPVWERRVERSHVRRVPPAGRPNVAIVTAVPPGPCRCANCMTCWLPCQCVQSAPVAAGAVRMDPMS